MRLIDVDNISDQEIVDYLGTKHASCLSDIRDMLNEQPTINQWIPCSERLPDNSRSMLVTLAHTYEPYYVEIGIARYIMFENKECHWCANHYGYLEWDKYSDGKGGCSSYKVIAWMPLPEPYKEGE